MKAKDYLSQYSEAMSMVSDKDSRVIVVDNWSKFQFVSPLLANESKLSSYELENKTYADLPVVSNLAGSCVSEDLLCRTKLKKLSFLTMQTHEDGRRLYYKHKSPIIMPNSNEAVGVKVEFVPVGSLGRLRPVISDQILRFNSNNIKLNHADLAIELTEVEELILFLLLVYARPKLITQQVNHITGKSVAVSTVRNIIHQQLLRKFDAVNLDELVEKAVLLRYDTIVPRLIKEPCSTLLDECFV